jgi:hypothetical protein
VVHSSADCPNFADGAGELSKALHAAASDIPKERTATVATVRRLKLLSSFMWEKGGGDWSSALRSAAKTSWHAMPHLGAQARFRPPSGVQRDDELRLRRGAALGGRRRTDARAAAFVGFDATGG